MSKIRSTVPAAVMEGRLSDAPMLPCVWCGEPTAIMAETPFRPDLGAVPLMLTCSAKVLIAYRAYRDGRVLTEDERAGMRRLVA